MGCYLGIEIGGTKLQVVAGNAEGAILARRRAAVEVGHGAEGIRRQIENLAGELLVEWEIEAVGVGFGGPVDRVSGRVTRSHQVPGWSGFDLGGWVGELTGLPVVLDNDANIAALGEAVRGAGVGANPMFYVTLGSGVGGGLVVNGGIYHGASPGESEIGHIRLDREGTLVEERCSGWAVDRRIRALKRAGGTSLLGRLCGGEEGGEARHLAAALKQGDAEAERILAEVGGDLAFGLSHVVQLQHPERIVLGGGLSLLGEPLRSAVAEALPRWVMRVFGGGPEIRIAALGEDAVPVGCLLAAARHLDPGAGRAAAGDPPGSA